MLRIHPTITRFTLLFSLFLSVCHWQCQPAQASEQPIVFVEPSQKVKGLNFVAPPSPFPKDPMPPVKAVGANWIAVIPYAYTRLNEANVHYNRASWQWWGERPEGCRKTVELANSAGLNIMLKPQVYVPGSWTGGIDFADEEDWEKWEQDYEAYILPMVELAEQKGIAMFCIGTEFKVSSQKREAFWRQLIQKIRARYSGKLTYAANWDEYDKIQFWDALDYIGVNAYFPLVDSPTPELSDLIKAWQEPLKTIRQFSEKQKKPVLFTEFGYLSVDGCAYKTWELEAKVRQMPINEQAQANALNALFSVFWEQPFWAGGFLWKWFPNMQGHEGYVNKDYTPQGKQGEEVLKEWYNR